jgi:hypothetical protein
MLFCSFIDGFLCLELISVPKCCLLKTRKKIVQMKTSDFFTRQKPIFFSIIKKNPNNVIRAIARVKN